MARGNSFGPNSHEESAEEALAKAELVLSAVRAQTPEVSQLGATLRMYNDRNHYAEKLAETMRRAQR